VTIDVTERSEDEIVRAAGLAGATPRELADGFRVMKLWWKRECEARREAERHLHEVVDYPLRSIASATQVTVIESPDRALPALECWIELRPPALRIFVGDMMTLRSGDDVDRAIAVQVRAGIKRWFSENLQRFFDERRLLMRTSRSLP
jgi:hypothetical protein